MVKRKVCQAPNQIMVCGIQSWDNLNIILLTPRKVTGTLQQNLSSFDYNGFTLGNNTMTNQSGQTYVAWCWKSWWKQRYI